MQKIDIKFYLSIVIAIIAIIFDVLIIEGWAASILYLIMSTYWLAKAILGRKQLSAYKKAMMGLSVFALTTLFGYSLSCYVQSDFTQSARKVKSNYPASRQELLNIGNRRVSWFTQFCLIGYTTADGMAFAQFRLFPYQIGEYNFVTKEFSVRSYD